MIWIPRIDDVRELYPDPFPYEDYVAYLNTPQVQSAIGAFVNFSESSNVVSQAFVETGDDGRESMTIEDIRSLLGRNITVTLWAGDADYNCNWLGGQVVADHVNHEGYSKAGYANLQTIDTIQVRVSAFNKENGMIHSHTQSNAHIYLVSFFKTQNSTAKQSRVDSFPLQESMKVVMKYPFTNQ